MYNQDRAERAERHLLAHAYEIGANEDRESSIIDLLADLMHLCDQDGIDFDDSCIVARTNYEAEKDDEAGEDPAECRECGDPLNDGEGYDGLCGTCADREEGEDEEQEERPAAPFGPASGAIGAPVRGVEGSN